MIIDTLDIANFRKLRQVRIKLDSEKTVFVGANNSGKTSAMTAIRRFLAPKAGKFDVFDITLCHWSSVDAIGNKWLSKEFQADAHPPDAFEWHALLPSLDVWLQVEEDELHHVYEMIPTLDWNVGLLGVRLQLEPEDPVTLFREFVSAEARAARLKAAAPKGKQAQAQLDVWPADLIDFLRKRLSARFIIRAYPLDPAKADLKHEGVPQEIDWKVPALPQDPFAGLIRIDDVSADRGFLPSSGERPSNRLSDQLRTYYRNHLDPTTEPEAADLEALAAVKEAQTQFDDRLAASFEPAFRQVSTLGYPGVSDPSPVIATKIAPADSIDHPSALTFKVNAITNDGKPAKPFHLPEDRNGLGYQNLLSLVFKLMAARDAWMRVGKAGIDLERVPREPLHLVLLEEPEVNLHAQVQQVLVQKAYGILRNDPRLEGDRTLRTQLLLSTHSSHITYDTPFHNLRYFYRLSGEVAQGIPTSEVLDVSHVFGTETAQFVKRYIRATHADLFFADGIILVEGAAEWLLLPHFIDQAHQSLTSCYLTILEIGGSHAHRLRDLVEHLRLPTLVITDIDSASPSENGGKPEHTWPRAGSGQVTQNSTLSKWVPERTDIDGLLEATAQERTRDHVHVAYQQAHLIEWSDAGDSAKAYPYTFEDALVLTNLAVFRKTKFRRGLAKKCSEAVGLAQDVQDLQDRLFGCLKDAKKAEFAMDLMELDDDAFGSLRCPPYISEGLEWLQDRLAARRHEALGTQEVKANA